MSAISCLVVPYIGFNIKLAIKKSIHFVQRLFLIDIWRYACVLFFFFFFRNLMINVIAEACSNVQ